MSSLSHLITERRNPLTSNIDEKSTIDILKCINDEDRIVANAVETQLTQIASVVDCVVECMKNDGRLVYVGCGSSGRLGVIGISHKNISHVQIGTTQFM